MIKSAAELLKVAALRTRIITIRDAEVAVRELSIRERQEFIELSAKESRAAYPGAWLIKTCVVGPGGEQLFDDESAAQLAQSSPEVIDVVARGILEISNLLKVEKEDAEKKD